MSLDIEKLSKPTYAIYKTEIFNVVPSNRTRQNMFGAAMAAFMRMKVAGESNFKVKVESDGYESGSQASLQQVALASYRQFIMTAHECAAKMIPVDQLSMEQKFAICVACGVKLRTEMSDKLILKTETENLCAVTIEDGKYVIYEMLRPT